MKNLKLFDEMDTDDDLESPPPVEIPTESPSPYLKPMPIDWEIGWTHGPRTVARVAVPVPPPADSVYDYFIPDGLRDRVEVGWRVAVPFGRRVVEGIVVEMADSPHTGLSAIKPLVRTPDTGPLFDAHMLKLTRWMAEYYACSWGEALVAALPAGVRKKAGHKYIIEVQLAAAREAIEIAERELAASDATAKQAKVLRTLLTFSDPFTPTGLARRLGITLSPLRTLKRHGLIRYEKVLAPLPDDIFELEDEPPPPDALTDEQESALGKLFAAIEAGNFSPFLLQGVTGSGKTEIYIRAMERVLAQGRGAIVLVPEIALTPQTQRRFRARFGNVAVFHSGLTDRERFAQWQAVKTGESRVVIGPRSAIFAPVPNLGLIVVDEEHEPSYKQSNSPRYNARDVAVQRAAMTDAVVLLGSATPSLESRLNAETQKYVHLTLTRRVADRELPAVEIIDMATECAEQHRHAIFSRRLEDALTDCVDKRGEQAIVFLNRRGFHTYLHCPGCGYVMMCPSCDISLTYHRHLHKAICHYCFETVDAPTLCPECRATQMNYSGYGTQHIESTIKKIFPHFTVARMDSDSMTTRRKYEDTLRDFREGDIDVLIGTQMIAKGLDFPNVTLVGVVSADGALNMPDFRARERTFQLVAQVSGRAGRGLKPGTVIVQSFHPDEPAVKLAAAADYETFFRREIADRRNTLYPPFCRLVMVVAEGKDAVKVEKTLTDWLDQMRVLPAAEKCRLLGPAPAPLSLLRDRYRWQLFIKAPSSKTVRELLRDVRQFKSPHGVRVTIDVDPVDMM